MSRILAKGPLLTLITILCSTVSSGSSLWAEVNEGFTEPWQVIDVSTPEVGIIADLRVKKGDRLSRGDVIATLDTEVLLASLEVAKARAASMGQLEAAEIQLTLRQQRLERLRLLLEQGHSSPEEVDRAQADAALAQAKVRSVQEELSLNRLEVKQIEAQIERRIVRSPIDGVITRVYKEPGEFAANTDPHVATVVSLDSLRVKFYVTTSQASRLHVGKQLLVTISHTNQQSPGTVEFVSPVTDADSGTVRVEVAIKNVDGRFRSGVRCTIEPP